MDTVKQQGNQERRWSNALRNRIPPLEELNRPERVFYKTEDLVDIYFYINLAWNPGVIRRSLIQKFFREGDDMGLNFNYHPSPRTGIGQII